MKTLTSRFVLTAALAILLGGSFAGCTAVHVEPWERATLASYSLRPDRDPLATAMAEHTFFSREAANGGRGVGGSGCGCN
ncbi:MAG: putative lipoprotein [Verrucomicrobia bacterium]|nr:putative lipoprotein [Verrucomicrobiota bacterium]